MRLDARVRPVNPMQRFGVARIAELLRPITAVQRQRLFRRQLISQRFELLRRRQAALLRQKVHHFAVHVQAAELGEAANEGPDLFRKQRGVRTSLAHECRQCGGGIQHHEPSFGNGRRFVTAQRFEMNRYQRPVDGAGHHQERRACTPAWRAEASAPETSASDPAL